MAELFLGSPRRQCGLVEVFFGSPRRRFGLPEPNLGTPLQWCSLAGLFFGQSQAAVQVGGVCLAIPGDGEDTKRTRWEGGSCKKKNLKPCDASVGDRSPTHFLPEHPDYTCQGAYISFGITGSPSGSLPALGHTTTVRRSIQLETPSIGPVGTPGLASRRRLWDHGAICPARDGRRE